MTTTKLDAERGEGGASFAPAVAESVVVEANPDGERRLRLGAFIRLHRQQLSPEAVGLASTPRKRTPGLRREDLAQLCRVSSTWITWLEQGRDVAASSSVLARLADALRLQPAERGYLFELAGRRDPAEPRVESEEPRQAVLASVKAMACPAYVLDRQWNVIACNARATDLFLDWGRRPASGAPSTGDEAGVRDERGAREEPGQPAGQLSPGEPANLLRFLFLAPQARSLIDDWPGRAARLVAEFRADSGRLADEPPLHDLVESLAKASPEFAALWASQDVLAREGGERRFLHPRLGPLAYDQLTLTPNSRRDLRLVMLLPR